MWQWSPSNPKASTTKGKKFHEGYSKEEIPIVNLRVKKAISKRGAKLIVIHPDAVDFDRHRQTVHMLGRSGSCFGTSEIAIKCSFARSIIGHVST